MDGKEKDQEQRERERNGPGKKRKFDKNLWLTTVKLFKQCILMGVSMAQMELGKYWIRAVDSEMSDWVKSTTTTKRVLVFLQSHNSVSPNVDGILNCLHTKCIPMTLKYTYLTLNAQQIDLFFCKTPNLIPAYRC